MINKREKGKYYEDLACKYLISCGYNILLRNFYYHGGEIDIIAYKSGIYRFIEVKYRKNNKYGYAIDSINSTKIKNIIRGIRYYIYKNNLCNESISVEAITIDNDKIQHETIDLY